MPGTNRIGQRTRQTYIEGRSDPFHGTLMNPDVVHRKRVHDQLEEGHTAAANIDEKEPEIRSNDREGDPREAGTRAKICDLAPWRAEKGGCPEAINDVPFAQTVSITGADHPERERPLDQESLIGIQRSGLSVGDGDPEARRPPTPSLMFHVKHPPRGTEGWPVASRRG
jgi:hypothetical protein